MRLVRGAKSDFGRMFGAEKPLFALLSHPSMMWLALKGLRWRSYGVTGIGGGWNFRFERHFIDWELEEAQRFLCVVNTKSLNPLSDDRQNGAKDGTFSVKSSYDLLEGGRQQLVPVKMIWNPLVLTKVGFFVWEVWWGKILINLKNVVSPLPVGVLSVGRRKKYWSIFLSTGLRFRACGLPCFLYQKADESVLTWLKS